MNLGGPHMLEVHPWREALRFANSENKNKWSNEFFKCMINYFQIRQLETKLRIEVTFTKAKSWGISLETSHKASVNITYFSFHHSNFSQPPSTWFLVICSWIYLRREKKALIHSS